MRALVLAAALTLASCAHNPQPAPNADASPSWPASCASVCEHGSLLGCEWSKPTRKGHSCEAVCLSNANAGQPWSLECIQRLSTCDLATACP
jgi:hypothetical protein